MNFCLGEYLYIWMPADLDQFGGEYSHGAVIGGKGLVQLGHVAANARCLLNHVNLKTGSGQVERGLNTADAAAYNHDVTKFTVSGITASRDLTKLLYFFF